MDSEQATHLRSLAEEYVTFVETMRSGQYNNSDEWQRLSGDRTLVHDELLRLTGMTRRDDMYHNCRELLAKGASSV